MGPKWVWGLPPLVLALACAAWSAEIILGWEVAGGIKAPQAFTYVRMTPAQTDSAPQEVTLTPWADDAACAAIWNRPPTACRRGGYHPGETVCATLAVPGAGAYTVFFTAYPQLAVQIGLGAEGECIPYAEALAAAMPPEQLLEVSPAPLPSEAEATPLPAAPASDPLAVSPPVVEMPLPSVPLSPPQPLAAPVVPATVSVPLTVPLTPVIPRWTPEQPWQAGSFAGTTADGVLDPHMLHAGSPTIALTGEGRFFAYTTSPRFAVREGETYTMAAPIKLDGVEGHLEMNVFWYDTQGHECHVWGEALGGKRSGTQDWQVLGGTVTAPAGARQAAIQWRLVADGGTAWIDPRVQVAVAEERQATEATTAVGTTSAPAVTLQGQMDTLMADYAHAQQTILARYTQAVEAAQRTPTPEAMAVARQTYAVSTAQLDALYARIQARYLALAMQALLLGRRPATMPPGEVPR